MTYTKLMTRKQIINEWLQQHENMLDSLCCPRCRDILEESGTSNADRWYCRSCDELYQEIKE